MQRDLWSAFAERSQRRAERAERLRRLDTDLDWRSWLRHRFAPYWYGLLVVFADIAVLASVFSFLPRPAGPESYAIAIGFVVPTAYLEWELYRILWPGDDEVLESLERKAAATRAATGLIRPESPENPADGRPPGGAGGDGGTRET